MNLIHGPLVEPPTLKALGETKYPNDLGPNERKVGHMITYMDVIVGRFVDKVVELGLEENTLIIFTGDNGSAGNQESRLAARGGSRTVKQEVINLFYWDGETRAAERPMGRHLGVAQERWASVLSAAQRVI